VTIAREESLPFYRFRPPLLGVSGGYQNTQGSADGECAHGRGPSALIAGLAAYTVKAFPEGSAGHRVVQIRPQKRTLDVLRFNGFSVLACGRMAADRIEYDRVRFARRRFFRIKF
jgi:hypothetical protein